MPQDFDTSNDVQFRYPVYCWATTWLRNRAWEEIKNNEGEMSIMRFLLDRNNVSTARAFAFEPHVFCTVENTGFNGRAKCLATIGTVEIANRQSIKSLTRVMFSAFSEIANTLGAHAGKFYVPTQTNHASLDFYVPNAGLLVQVTVGQKHGIKRKGLENAINSGIFDEWKTANPTKKLRLIFLCDTYNYASFTRQQYLTEKGVLKSRHIIDRIDNQVEQYAWELDVGKQLQAHTKQAKAKTSRVGAPIDWLDNKLDPLAGKGKEKSTDKGTSAAVLTSSTSTIPSKRRFDDVDSSVDDGGDE